MRIGIIGGYGHITYPLRDLRGIEDVELAAIAPSCAEEPIDGLAGACQRRGFMPKQYASPQALFDQGGVSLVVLAGEFHTTGPLAMEAFERGLHVCAEKPLALSLEQLTEVRQAFHASGKHLTVLLERRYDPAFRAAKRAIDDGRIGAVRLLNAQKSYRLGTRPEFYKHRARMGGLIVWVAIHAIDWIAWTSGQRFGEVAARHSNRANQDHGDLETTALCMFHLSADVYASLTADYLRPQAAPSHDDDRLRVAGTEGVVEVMGGRTLLIRHGQAETQLPPEPGAASFAAFVEQIRGGAPCCVSAQDGFIATDAALRAREAADSGGWVKF